MLVLIKCMCGVLRAMFERPALVWRRCVTASALCADITTTLATLSEEDKREPSVAHALQVRTAWSHGNYVK